MRLHITEITAIAALSLAALAATAAPASAHEWRSRGQVVQRCDRDGGVCATFRCDWDGDDCYQISPWRRRYAYYNNYPRPYGYGYDERREEWREHERAEEWREHHHDRDDDDE